MDNILGELAFAGIVVAQFLAVVAVSKWNASTSATDDLHRGAMPARTICAEGHENKALSLYDRAALDLAVHKNSSLRRTTVRLFRFIAGWRAARRAARQRHIQDIAKKGLAAIE